jgi:hypothetical protein
MVFDVFCDGNEDCAASDKCMDVRGDIITLRCERDDTNGCGLYRDLCTDVGECPGCATSCSPTTFADLTTEAYDLGVCR